MTDLIIVVYLISLAIGSTALLMTFIGYRKTHEPVLGSLSLFIGALTLRFIIAIINLYIRIAGKIMQFGALLPILIAQFVTLGFITAAYPFFIEKMADRANKRVLRTTSFIVAVAATFVPLFFVGAAGSMPSYLRLLTNINALISPVLFLLLSVSGVVLLFRTVDDGNPYRKLADRTTFTIFAVFIFFFTAEIADSWFGFNLYPRNYTGFSLFYLVLSVAIVLYLLRFVDTRISLEADIKEIPNTFADNFEITKREKEIMELLLTGKKYTDIAASLFISLKTVETHIAHIYRKTGVKSREEMIRKMADFL